MRLRLMNVSIYDVSQTQQKRKEEAVSMMKKSRLFLQRGANATDFDMRRRYMERATDLFEQAQKMLR